MKDSERVLVVELNARHPALAERLHLQATHGMTHYLSGQAPLSAIVASPERLGYDVVHVGEQEAGRVQMHLSSSFPRFLREALTHYDTVLIDAPPVIAAPETPPVAGMVDGVVVVVKCDKTKREIVQRSLSMIRQFNGNILGVVLNRKKYYIPEFIYRRI